MGGRNITWSVEVEEVEQHGAGRWARVVLALGGHRWELLDEHGREMRFALEAAPAVARRASIAIEAALARHEEALDPAQALAVAADEAYDGGEQ